MNVFLALASAMVLGSADFAGGLAAKKASAVAVVILSNTAGLVTALALVGLVSPSGTGRQDVLWGGLAGLCGSAGAILLYSALAGGVMSLVAPTTAAAAAAAPVLAGIALGDRLSAPAVVGVGAALVAVLLVSLGGDDGSGGGRRETARSLALALLAGAGFGAFFVFLSRTPDDHSMWPLVWARCASLSLLLVMAAARGTSLRMDRAPARPAVLSGFLDMSSSALFLIAVKHGSLAVVGLLSSLYPISTVLLARAVLDERIRRVQLLGVTLAVCSVLLLAWS